MNENKNEVIENLYYIVEFCFDILRFKEKK